MRVDLVIDDTGRVVTAAGPFSQQGLEWQKAFRWDTSGSAPVPLDEPRTTPAGVQLWYADCTCFTHTGKPVDTRFWVASATEPAFDSVDLLGLGK